MKRKIEALEQELKATAEKYRNLYENSPDMHVSVDPKDASIKDCNKTLALKSGYSKEEIIGKPIFFMYHPDCMAEVEKAFQSFVENGRVVNAELEIKKKDGSKIPVLLNVEAIKDEDGKILYSNSSWRDITEIKQLQQINQELEKKEKQRTAELEQKNRELSQFAYIASHDLQEPLRTVISFTELLEEQYNSHLDEKAGKYLHFISQASQRMSALIKGLLDYSRLGRNKEIANVDCNTLVKAIQEDLSANIAETGTTFNVGELPQLDGYETELRMLFQNLITNAIKFRRKGTAPTINISAQKEGDHWKLSFKDNGIGIADEHKERIFTIFQRLHAQSQYEGTGIGLAHCQKVVELHGGKIWVDSQLNEGSTFYITLKK